MTGGGIVQIDHLQIHTGESRANEKLGKNRGSGSLGDRLENPFRRTHFQHNVWMYACLGTFGFHHLAQAIVDRHEDQGKTREVLHARPTFPEIHVCRCHQSQSFLKKGDSRQLGMCQWQ